MPEAAFWGVTASLTCMSALVFTVALAWAETGAMLWVALAWAAFCAWLPDASSAGTCTGMVIVTLAPAGMLATVQVTWVPPLPSGPVAPSVKPLAGLPVALPAV